MDNQQQTKQAEKKYIPGFPKVDCVPVKCDEEFMVDLKVKFDPATGKTTPDDSNKVNLHEIIQTYKDQCGMELAKKLIRTGQVPPDAFKDDAHHDYNCAAIPEGRQALDNLVIQNKAQVDALAAGLGIPSDYGKLTDDQLTSLVKEYISRNSDKFIKPSAPVKEAE